MLVQDLAHAGTLRVLQPPKAGPIQGPADALLLERHAMGRDRFAMPRHAQLFQHFGHTPLLWSTLLTNAKRLGLTHHPLRAHPSGKFRIFRDPDGAVVVARSKDKFAAIYPEPLHADAAPDADHQEDFLADVVALWKARQDGLPFQFARSHPYEPNPPSSFPSWYPDLYLESTQHLNTVAARVADTLFLKLRGERHRGANLPDQVSISITMRQVVRDGKGGVLGGPLHVAVLSHSNPNFYWNKPLLPDDHPLCRGAVAHMAADPATHAPISAGFLKDHVGCWKKEPIVRPYRIGYTQRIDSLPHTAHARMEALTPWAMPDGSVLAA